MDPFIKNGYVLGDNGYYIIQGKKKKAIKQYVSNFTLDIKTKGLNDEGLLHLLTCEITVFMPDKVTTKTVDVHRRYLKTACRIESVLCSVGAFWFDKPKRLKEILYLSQI